MDNQFIVFEEYAKVVKQMLENVCRDDSMNVGNDAVQVVYATPPAAFSKWSIMTENGEKPGPLISFYLEGIDVEASEALNGWSKISIDGGKTFTRAPVVAHLRYKVTINAIKESQADLLQSQIMLASPFQHPYATKLNGQWVTMVSNSFANEASIELETDTDRVSKRTLSLEIQRAYIDYLPQITEHFIQEINNCIYSIEKLPTKKND